MLRDNFILFLQINRKGFFFYIIIISYLMVLGNCKTKEQKEAPTSISSQPDSVISLPTEEKSVSVADNIIKYDGTANDQIKKALETFSPITEIYSLANIAIHIKDSIEIARGVEQLTDPEDSLTFAPYENSVYQAILSYKQLMASGRPLQDICPDLINLNRTTEPGDLSLGLLPQAGESKFLSDGNFFFLGGAPFISKLRKDDNTVYTDSQGNPETRFESSVTENGNYLLNSIYHFKNGPINITFGPPLRSYDSGPKEVKGIGSLVHNFVNRIPVFFLTETGLVPAHLISITLKLVPEDLGCVSDQPYIEFACSKNIGEDEILGIYISYSSTPIISSTVSRPLSSLWTADINGDGIAEIACVSSTSQGNISDSLVEVLWFVNINGVWKIIDWGQELDCT